MSAESPPPIPQLIRSLALEGERLQLSARQLPPQPALVLPPPVNADGFSVVTVLPAHATPPALVPGSPVALRGRLNEVPISFIAALRDLQLRGDEWQIDLAWPLRLDYPQRRSRPRIPVPVGHPAAEAVIIGHEEVLLATVTDLHREGVGLQLRAAGVALPPDEDDYRCEIGRDDARIRLRLRVGHRRITDDHLRCGGRIVPITVPDDSRLDHLVAELERLWLRQRRHPQGH